MKIITTLEHEPFKDFTAIALGTFDGMHKGHVAIIENMLGIAKKQSLKSVVFTFSDIPKYEKNTNNTNMRIMSTDEKLTILEKMGVDYTVVLPFDKRIRQMSHQIFLDYMLNILNIKFLTVGYNFKFGLGAKGTVQWLEEMATKYSFSCNIMPPVCAYGEPISSTRIRRYLIEGKIEKANGLLGRNHFVRGVVKEGKKLGHTIGFATANLTIDAHMTNIQPGVYITKTQVGDKVYKSVTNVGFNPTFEQEDFNLETHILDFKQNLYGKIITVSFIIRLRDELKLNSKEELIEWIKKDVEMTKKHFGI